MKDERDGRTSRELQVLQGLQSCGLTTSTANHLKLAKEPAVTFPATHRPENPVWNEQGAPTAPQLPLSTAEFTLCCPESNDFLASCKAASRIPSDAQALDKNGSFISHAASGNTFTEAYSTPNILIALKSSIHDILLDPSFFTRSSPCKLAQSDYIAWKKINVDVEGTIYRCKSYAPQVFREMRTSCFHIDDSHLISSIGQSVRNDTKSYVSKDGKYLIKKIPSAEAKRLLKILPAYFEHMRANPDSLLCRFLALCRIKPRKSYLLVMSNVLATPRDIHQRYDIKACSSVRHAKSRESTVKHTVVMDMDLLMTCKRFTVGKQMKRDIVSQLHRDTSFLTTMNLMDYSLCVGVHKQKSSPGVPSGASSPLSKASFARTASGSRLAALLDRHMTMDSMESSYSVGSDNALSPVSADGSGKASSFLMAELHHGHVPHFQQYDGGVASLSVVDGSVVKGKRVYYFGIVDFLQEFDWRKQVKRRLQSVFQCKRKSNCVEPQYYADRFIRRARLVLE